MGSDDCEIAKRLGVSNLLQGFTTIPFYRFGHDGLELFQIFRGAPTDIVMLSRGESQSALFRPRPVNHADVLVGVGNAMNIEKAGSDQSASSRRSGRRPFSDEFDFEAAFLSGFPERGLFGIFVEFDMAAKGKPLIELTMVDE